MKGKEKRKTRKRAGEKIIILQNTRNAEKNNSAGLQNKSRESLGSRRHVAGLSLWN